MWSISGLKDQHRLNTLLTKTQEGVDFIKKGGRGSGNIYDTTGKVRGYRVAVNVNAKDRNVQVVCYTTRAPLTFIKQRLEEAGHSVSGPHALASSDASWSLEIQVPS